MSSSDIIIEGLDDFEKALTKLIEHDYPKEFEAVKNGTTKNTIKNKELLDKLREIESGKWTKVYKDGYNSSGNKISIHYFQSQSGKVFNVKVKPGWSN